MTDDRRDEETLLENDENSNKLNKEERRKLEQDEPKKENVIWEWFKSIVIALLLAFIIKTFFYEPTRVQGTSMNHTLENEDRVIVDKISMKFRELKRGDIIVMEFDTSHDYIKRIVGLPGEIIQIIDGQVYINGNLFEEEYIYGDETGTINGFEWRLGEDEYFVMGDNRTPGGSTDSRVFGPVNIEKIRGVANFRFYPLDEIGLLK